MEMEGIRTMMKMRSWGIDRSTAQGLQAVIPKYLHGEEPGAKIISVAKIPFIFFGLLAWMDTQERCWKVVVHHGYCSIIYFCFAGIAYALRNTILQSNIY